MEEERKYSAEIAAAVNKFLVDDDWRFDFSEEEVCLATEAGFTPISLGPSRLRTETAALVACHILNLKNQ